MGAREAVLVMGACFALVLQCAHATTYTVGGSSNWTIPATAGNAQLYTNWVSGKTFKLGDVLEFNFVSGQHDVLEVTKANYDSCVIASPMAKHETPPVKIPLNTTGAHYYICSIGTHCQSGQKLEVTVAASTPTPSPSPSPSSSGSPPASTPPAEAPSTPTTPTTPSPTTPTTPSPTTPTTPSPTTPTPSSGTPPPANSPTNDNSSASRLAASLGVLSGVAALFLL